MLLSAYLHWNTSLLVLAKNNIRSGVAAAHVSPYIKGQVIRATFSHNLSRNIVALQVEKGCCPYYHLGSQLVTQQISMLQVAARKKSCVVIGQQCVFVSANKMAC